METLSNHDLLNKAYSVPGIVVNIYAERGVSIHSASLSGSFSRGDFHREQQLRHRLDVDVVCNAGPMTSANFRQAQNLRLRVQKEAHGWAGLPDNIPVDIQFVQDDWNREANWG